MKSIAISLAALLISTLSATESLAAMPQWVQPGVPYGDVVGGCAYVVHFGQYGVFAYAHMVNYGSGSACDRFESWVSVTNFPDDGYAWRDYPQPGQWLGNVIAGTFGGAEFYVHASNGCSYYVRFNRWGSKTDESSYCP